MCGFIRGDPGCEMGPSGQATLQGMVHFCRRFPCISAEMIWQYSHHGKKGQTISFSALCGQVGAPIQSNPNLFFSSSIHKSQN